MEEFKKIDEMMEYDYRFDIFVGDNIYDKDKPSGLKLHHIYEQVENIILHENVHENIQSQFNIAKNIFVYSWYCYPFTQVAELKVISTLEFALKMKFGNKVKSLRKLLNYAIDNNYLIDSSLYEREKQWQEKDMMLGKELTKIDYKERTKKTAELLCMYRNKLAHGSTILTPPQSKMFEITADFINQLFK